MLKMLDLFSGIGGFSLAASWTGAIETAAFCEIEPFCQRILRKHWPEVPIFPDIKELRGRDIGPVDIVSGGFPCQPFSCAGKQRGKEDDRYLWPEMLRVIAETKPTWIVGENVANIVNLALDTVLFELEAQGYTALPLIIPACGVNAPHRRERVWILAYSQRTGARNKPREVDLQKWDAASTRAEAIRQTHGKACTGRVNTASQNVAGSDSERQQEQRWPEPVRQRAGRTESQCGGSHIPDSNDGSGALRRNGEFSSTSKIKKSGSNNRGRTEKHEPGEWWEAEPDVGRVVDGVSSKLDGGGLIEQMGDSEKVTEDDYACWEILRTMWINKEFRKTPSELRGRKVPDTLQKMPYRNGSAAWHPPQEANKELYYLWERISTVTFEEAYHLLPQLLTRIRQNQCNEAMDIWREEPSIPRVATGITNRVDRLRGLGNAIVPQVAHEIFKAIVEIEQGG